MSQNQSKEKIAFIINPKSGTQQKLSLPQLIEKKLDSSRFEAEYIFTKCAGHATELAKEFVEKKYSRVIAVGGDGTVNEVAKALVDSSTALGIIPCGSGNGLGRFLHIPLKIEEAVELQNRGKSLRIDYGRINKEPFFCTCGVGFDAHIGNKFAQSTKRGFFTYIKETFSAYFRYKPKIFGKGGWGKIKTRAFLVTVANAGQYGNDAYIAPQADICDGFLDICIMSPFPKHKAFGLGFRLFNRSINNSEYLQTFKGKEVSIKRKKKGEVHLDGEPAIMGKKLKIKIIEKGLSVIVPR